MAKLAKLKKMRSSAEKEGLMSKFFAEEYILPRLGYHKGRVISFSPQRPPRKRKIECDDQVKEMRQKMYDMTRNANKRIKRRDAAIQKQVDCIRTQQKTIEDMKRKLLGSDSQVKKLRAKLDRINHLAVYWKKRLQDISISSDAKKKELSDKIVSLKEEVASLAFHNSELNDTIQSILSSEPQIATFENGKYTDDVRACVYELLSLNVGVRNVAPIIRCVLENIAHKSAQRLPSYGITCKMMIESLAIVQAQLGVGLSEMDGFTTSQTDGTTKFGEHFATYDVKTESFSYSLGLRHVFSGSANDTLETLKEILSDIDSVQLSLGKEAVSSRIIAKIKNTMSDRHAAEKLFNELVSDFRAEILPTIVDNWDELSDVEREQMTCMNNFFCGLHYLVGLAECSDKTISFWESSSCDNKLSSGSSAAQRLIRSACKAFHHKGSQQCGTSTLFRSYLKQQGIFKLPLAPFVGNCFNILFYDGAGVYYLQRHMIEFLQKVRGKNANRLLESVLKNLMNPMLIAACRALGLIDKIVTGPLWRRLEESSISVLEMGYTYCQLKVKFDTWASDSSTLICRSARCIDDDVIHDDEVCHALIKPDSTDAMTQELLQLLFHTFSVTTQRLLIPMVPITMFLIEV